MIGEVPFRLSSEKGFFSESLYLRHRYCGSRELSRLISPRNGRLSRYSH